MEVFCYDKAMKPAIIVVDAQQDFFHDGRLKQHKDILVQHINALTDYGRNYSIPIIWVRQEFKKDFSDAPLGIKKGLTRRVTAAGTEGAKLLSELHVKPKDYQIIKKRYSAFFKTELDNLLKKLNVNTAVIGGVNSHACVRMAAIDAYQRDYEILLATDCIDSYDEAHHLISVRYLSGVISQPKTNTQLFRLFATRET